MTMIPSSLREIFVSNFTSLSSYLFNKQSIISKTMSTSLILLLTISFFVSKDYNLARILIKRFSEKKFLKENISSKDIELKIDNLNYNSLINNSLNWTFKMYWKLRQKLRKKEIESQHKYQEIVRSNILKN